MIAWTVLACSGGGKDDGTTPLDQRELAGPFVGSALVVDGDTLWVSAPGGGTSEAPGSWFALDAPVAGGSRGDAVRTLTGATSADLGGGLAVCRDGTVIAGAPGRGERGGAWLLGPGDDDVGAQAFAEGLYEGGRAGAAVVCGELSGEGPPDFVVSAPESDTELPGAGTLAVYSLVDGAPDKIANVDTTWAGAALGDRSALVLTDVDSDGVDDLVVGGPGSDRVHLVRGPVVGASFTNASPTFQGDDGEWTGAGVAVGDVTGDGVPDLVAGAPLGAAGRGGFWVLPGPLADANGLLELRAQWVGGISVDAELGASVAFVGDVDGDGREDFLVGAPGAPGASPDSGAAYLVTAATLPSLVDIDGADATLLPSAAAGRFGYAVAGGDLDGDGVIELYVGAPEADVGAETGVGEVVVFPASVRGTVYDTDEGATIR
jgi:hypothetical protein